MDRFSLLEASVGVRWDGLAEPARRPDGLAGGRFFFRGGCHVYRHPDETPGKKSVISSPDASTE